MQRIGAAFWESGAPSAWRDTANQPTTSTQTANEDLAPVKRGHDLAEAITSHSQLKQQQQQQQRFQSESAKNEKASEHTTSRERVFSNATSHNNNCYSCIHFRSGSNGTSHSSSQTSTGQHGKRDSHRYHIGWFPPGETRRYRHVLARNRHQTISEFLHKVTVEFEQQRTFNIYRSPCHMAPQHFGPSDSERCESWQICEPALTIASRDINTLQRTGTNQLRSVK